MTKMQTSYGFLWFFGGVAWFFALVAFVVWGPWTSKITPPETARTFFSAAQYNLLYNGRPRFDAQHPNAGFVVSAAQKAKLANWGLNDCVGTDGTAAQDTSFLSGACFCENSPAVKAVFDTGWAVQPSNTLSTVTRSVVGLIILGFLVFGDVPGRTNFMTTTYFFPLCYVFMTVALGPLSMALHLGLHSWGGLFDSISLYVWFGFVACYGFYRFILALVGTTADQCPRWTWILFGVAWLLCILLAAGLTTPGHGDSDLWYIGLGAAALVGEGLLWLGNVAGFARSPATSFAPDGADHWWSKLPWDTGGRTWFASAGIMFFLALAIWVLSFTQHPLCGPDSGFQGHAVFHSLSAVAAGFLYKYYRHEGEVSVA